jgi:hypothetical protein
MGETWVIGRHAATRERKNRQMMAKKKHLILPLLVLTLAAPASSPLKNANPSDLKSRRLSGAVSR